MEVTYVITASCGGWRRQFLKISREGNGNGSKLEHSNKRLEGWKEERLFKIEADEIWRLYWLKTEIIVLVEYWTENNAVWRVFIHLGQNSSFVKFWYSSKWALKCSYFHMSNFV